MQTNFFRQIAKMNLTGDLQIIFTRTSENNYVVSVLLKNEQCGDQARKTIPPLNLRGTAEELDNGFFESIATSLLTASGLWDDDLVMEANLGRQLFAESEMGLHKSVALINRINRFFGTNWKSETQKFEKDNLGKVQKNMQSVIYISCVDNVKSRFEIAEILNGLKESRGYYINQSKYWLDFGNSQFSGQVLLSTIGNIRQPDSEKYETVENLPFITEEFGKLLKQSELEYDTPSCSLAEALEKQDLYINSTLAQMGSSLLWSLFPTE